MAYGVKDKLRKTQDSPVKPRSAMDVTPSASSLTAKCHSELYSPSPGKTVSQFTKPQFTKPPVAEVYFLCLPTGTPKETINRKKKTTKHSLLCSRELEEG